MNDAEVQQQAAALFEALGRKRQPRSTEDEDTSGDPGCLLALVCLMLGLATVPVRAWMISTLLIPWFLEPLGFPHVPFWHAVGALFLFVYIKGYADPAKTPKPTRKSLLISAGSNVAWHAFAFGWGHLIHWAMVQWP